MAELKTRPTGRSVQAFIAGIADERKRRDARALLALMRGVTRATPTMWGDSIVGFGRYHYVYGSGREGEWFLTGFSPRKGNLAVYIMAGVARYGALLERLGRHTTGSSCLYLRSLDDADLPTLRELVRRGVQDMRTRHR